MGKPRTQAKGNAKGNAKGRPNSKPHKTKPAGGNSGRKGGSDKTAGKSRAKSPAKNNQANGKRKWQGGGKGGSDAKRRRKDTGELLLKAEQQRLQDDAEETIFDDDDIAFFKNNPKYANTLNAWSGDTQTGKKKKKKNKEDSDEELDFEKAPRQAPWAEEESGALPVLSEDGRLVAQKTKTQSAPYRPPVIDPNQPPVIEDGAESEDDAANSAAEPPQAQQDDNESNTDDELQQAITAVMEQKKRRNTVKQKIAAHCMAVMEEPQTNYKKFGELVHLCSDPDHIISKLAIVSCGTLFKDLIPGYAIRESSEGDEDRLSHHYAKTRAFETSLLSSYKNYLVILDRSLRGKLYKEMDPATTNEFRAIAVEALGDLLATHPHFNFRKNVMTSLVPSLASPNRHLAAKTHASLRTAMSNDPTGVHTLDLVRIISNEVRSRNYNGCQGMLDLLLTVSLRSDLLTDRNLQEKAKKTKKKKRDDVDKELAQAEAQHANELVLSNHQAILGSLFVTFARVLKKAPNSSLMPTVLQGIGKFGHLVDLALLQDTIVNLKDLIDNPATKPELQMEAFMTLHRLNQGEAGALDIDLKRAHTCLYKLLGDLTMPASESRIMLLLRCLQQFLKERKMIEPVRAASFVKRLLTMAVCQAPHVSLSLLVVVRCIFEYVQKTQQLLDQEATMIGKYAPEVDDPDFANALSSTAWELCILTQSPHPALASFAKQVPQLGKLTSLPGTVGTPTDALKVFQTFDASLGDFNPPVAPPKSYPYNPKTVNTAQKARVRPLPDRPLRFVQRPNTPNTANTLADFATNSGTRKQQALVAARMRRIKAMHATWKKIDVDQGNDSD